MSDNKDVYGYVEHNFEGKQIGLCDGHTLTGLDKLDEEISRKQKEIELRKLQHEAMLKQSIVSNNIGNRQIQWYQDNNSTAELSRKTYSPSAHINKLPNPDGTTTLMVQDKYGHSMTLELDREAIEDLVKSAEVAGLRQTLMNG